MCISKEEITQNAKMYHTYNSSLGYTRVSSVDILCIEHNFLYGKKNMWKRERRDERAKDREKKKERKEQVRGSVRSRVSKCTLRPILYEERPIRFSAGARIQFIVRLIFFFRSAQYKPQRLKTHRLGLTSENLSFSQIASNFPIFVQHCSSNKGTVITFFTIQRFSISFQTVEINTNSWSNPGSRKLRIIQRSCFISWGHLTV